MKSMKFSYSSALVSSLKGYTKELFAKDLMSGLIVGIVALPLAIAFGIASGVSPENGIVTAILAGFITALFGGSRVQVSGPTGAFIVIVYGVVQNYGIEGLILATFMAGVLLVVMGLLNMGAIIKFIPYPIVLGFTAGISVTIFTTQIKDLFGLSIGSLPGGCIEQWMVYFQNFTTVNFASLAVGVVSILLILYTPKVLKKIPGSLVAIILTTIVVYLLRQYMGIESIETIGDRFTINATLPKPQGLDLSLESVKMLFPTAVTIALLGAIESLLSATVADGVTGHRHDSNSELVGQGIANIVVPFFGGIPATGAIARTMTNINNGGCTPISAIVHSVVLLLILLFLGSLSSLIPMAALAGVLMVVSYNMTDWRLFKAIFRAEKAELSVMLATFILTIVFDLTIAIEIGIMLALVLFIRRISATSSVSALTHEVTINDDPDSTRRDLLLLDDSVEVYEIDGPFFFGLATKFEQQMRAMGNTAPKVRIIRMRRVPFIDSTGLYNLLLLSRRARKAKTKIVLSGVNKQVRESIMATGLGEFMGEDNICDNIQQAIEKSKTYL